MEHGRVEIRYDPTCPRTSSSRSRASSTRTRTGSSSSPTPTWQGDFAVAVSAWSNAVGCPAYDPVVLDVISNFRDTYRGNGPENFPISL